MLAAGVAGLNFYSSIVIQLTTETRSTQSIFQKNRTKLGEDGVLYSLEKCHFPGTSIIIRNLCALCDSVVNRYLTVYAKNNSFTMLEAGKTSMTNIMRGNITLESSPVTNSPTMMIIP